MKHSFYILFFSLLLFSCSTDEKGYQPTVTTLDIPLIFSENILGPIIPSNNPQTVEGVALGKKLFFEKKLSNNNTKSCASCHHQQFGFSDNSSVSQGVSELSGTRNAMPLFNLAWQLSERFNWDGNAFSLELQAEGPITNPNELNSTWATVINKLTNDDEYPELFFRAFGTEDISRETITKALAQFQRTLISANSKFDRYSLGLETLTPQELNGLEVFLTEEKGDCFHCHGNPNSPLWTDNDFHNNGLETDQSISDLGLALVTGDPSDNGKFKTPSIRNLLYTAPYMHDGRFNTLEEVIDHYSHGLQPSSTIDPLMKKVNQGGVQLSEQDKADLKAFLLTLSDSEFISNPNFQ